MTLAPGIEVRMAPELQDLTRISKAITRISRIYSEGIQLSDYLFEISPF